MKKQMKFEDALTRIEEIVKILEQGDIPLEQALTLFEEGTGLMKICGKQLDEAEQQVVRLQKGADGEPVELPFTAEE